MPLPNLAEQKGDQESSEQNGTADNLCMEIFPIFMCFLKNAHRDWQINLNKESWRASTCTESTHKKRSLWKMCDSIFKRVNIEETSNFWNISLFSSFVVQTKLPTFKLHWKTCRVFSGSGWAASRRAGGWFKGTKITARRRTNPLIV